jgi:broad specificity phosphatase PhoE
VRHGETAWSITGQHTGWTDLPLTMNGEAQACALRDRLGEATFDHVLSSPLKRARRTCALAGFGGSELLDPDLMEWNYGEYEGRTLRDIHGVRPDWDLFRDGCPGGESVAEVSGRADRAVSGLRALGGRVVLFSSAHFLRVLASRWIGATAWFGRGLALEPASISVLGYEHDGADSVLRLWNVSPRQFG